MTRCRGTGGSRRLGARVATMILVAASLAACQSDRTPGLLEQGDAAWSAGDYQEADNLYARALEQDPSSRAAWLGRARAAVALRDPERALGFHGTLAGIDRTYWRAEARDEYSLALMEAARKRLEAGRPDAAVAALRALRRLDPDRAGSTELFAQALTDWASERAMRGDREAALELYREAISIDARGVAAYVGAAEILIGSGRKQEAMTLLEVARQTDPADNRVRALTIEALGLN